MTEGRRGQDSPLCKHHFASQTYRPGKIEAPSLTISRHGW